MGEARPHQSLTLRSSAAAALASACAVLLLALLPAAQNTLLIIADDVGYEDLERVETPNIDALAAQGVTFTSAYANGVCSPTRRSLFFGQWYRKESGDPCALANSAAPALGATSLPDLYSGDSALVGKWHVGGFATAGNCPPLEHGFDWWLAGTPGNLKVTDLESPCLGSGYTDWLRAVGSPTSCVSYQEPTYSAKKQRDMALLALSLGEDPRLVVFAPNLAHGPFTRPPAELLPANYPATTTDEEKYEAMIVALDRIVGELVAEVNLEETLVVFVGDNGTPENIADNGRAKDTVYEQGIHVPLIIAGGPTLATGTTSDELVHVVDLYATIAAWGGTGGQAGPGMDLTPTLTGSVHLPYHTFVACGTPGERCARSANAKLILRGQASEEFYLLPDETTNLVDELSLHALISQHRAFLEAALP